MSSLLVTFWESKDSESTTSFHETEPGFGSQTYSTRGQICRGVNGRVNVNHEQYFECIWIWTVEYDDPRANSTIKNHVTPDLKRVSPLQEAQFGHQIHLSKFLMAKFLIVIAPFYFVYWITILDDNIPKFDDFHRNASWSNVHLYVESPLLITEDSSAVPLYWLVDHAR